MYYCSNHGWRAARHRYFSSFIEIAIFFGEFLVGTSLAHQIFLCFRFHYGFCGEGERKNKMENLIGSNYGSAWKLYFCGECSGEDRIWAKGTERIEWRRNFRSHSRSPHNNRLFLSFLFSIMTSILWLNGNLKKLHRNGCSVLCAAAASHVPPIHWCHHFHRKPSNGIQTHRSNQFLAIATYETTMTWIEWSS